MCLSNADLALIVGRASNLAERLSKDFVPVEGDATVGVRRLARWKHVAADNDPGRFANVLRTHGLDDVSEQKLERLLGPVHLSKETAMPDWSILLREISKFMATSFATADCAISPLRFPTTRRQKLPYEHLYWPIADFALSRVRQSSPEMCELLWSHAWTHLQRQLMRRIDRIASAALHPAFLAHKSVHESGVYSFLFSDDENAEAAEGADRHYRSFVHDQGKDGLRSFFTRFPVVARLVASTTLSWVRFAQEFLSALWTDQAAICSKFNAGASLSGVRAIEAGISDPHRGGRSVLLLTFERGLRLLYKPRSLEIDRAYFDLVGELNTHNQALDLTVLNVLDRGDYGWMEFVNHSRCADRKAITRFYKRAGALTCVVHWLSGTDCHRENLVAAGEYPVLVDLESLAHPLRPDEKAGNDQFGLTLANSVLRTGLLPLWQRRFTNRGYFDNSGFGAVCAHRSFFPAVRWLHINTDRMQPEQAHPIQRHDTHRPKLGNRTPPIQHFEHEVVTGYRQMASVLEGLGSANFWRYRGIIQSKVRRYIRRPTLVYEMMLRRSILPDCLVDGVERSIELHGLPYLPGEEDRRSLELASLEELDIPYFQITDDAQANQPSHGQVVQPSSLIKQVAIIRESVKRQVCVIEGRIRRLSAAKALGAKPARTKSSRTPSKNDI